MSAFPVTHSIPDALGLKVETPEGNIVISGDLKLDHFDGEPTDYEKENFGALAKEKTLMLVADSTNAERPGFSITERQVQDNIAEIIRTVKDRLTIGIFASQLARIMSVFEVENKILEDLKDAEMALEKAGEDPESGTATEKPVVEPIQQYLINEVVGKNGTNLEKNGLLPEFQDLAEEEGKERKKRLQDQNQNAIKNSAEEAQVIVVFYEICSIFICSLFVFRIRKQKPTMTGGKTVISKEVLTKTTTSWMPWRIRDWVVISLLPAKSWANPKRLKVLIRTKSS